MMLLILDCYLSVLASAEALCQWCHLHPRDPQQSIVLQRDNDTTNMTTVKVESFLLVFAVILCTKVLTSSSNTFLITSQIQMVSPSCEIQFVQTVVSIVLTCSLFASWNQFILCSSPLIWMHLHYTKKQKQLDDMRKPYLCRRHP